MTMFGAVYVESHIVVAYCFCFDQSFKTIYFLGQLGIVSYLYHLCVVARVSDVVLEIPLSETFYLLATE